MGLFDKNDDGRAALEAAREEWAPDSAAVRLANWLELPADPFKDGEG